MRGIPCPCCFVFFIIVALSVLYNKKSVEKMNNRQSTLPALYVSGATDDNNVHKEESRTWYNSILGIVCGRMRKEYCARNGMRVTELTPTESQLVARITV